MTVTNTLELRAYAVIAQQTYDNTLPKDGITGDVPDGFGGAYVEITQDVTNDATGFQARAFFNTSKKELVIAFTGTEGFGSDTGEFVADLQANVPLAIAGVAPQVLQGQAFIAQAIGAATAGGNFGYDITYVGHSLGGFLAQAASKDGIEGEVVVFNAPGAGGFLDIPQSGTFSEDRYTYVYSDPDTWSLIGKSVHSVGNRLSDNILIVPEAIDHSIDNLVLGLDDAVTNNATLPFSNETIFSPVNEALSILGLAPLLALYDPPSDSPNPPTSEPGDLVGTSGDDTLTGTNGANVLNGAGGDDKLFGLNGNDTLKGGDGTDRLYGGSGDDRLEGGNGNDYLRDDGGKDKFIGGAGTDTASYYGWYASTAANTKTLEVNLSTGANNSADTYSSIENLLGSNTQKDVLTGTNGANVLNGAGGDDKLFGLNGNDTLKGGNGNDLLYAGDDNNHLFGGSGADTFVFELETGTNTIHDFEANKDKIDLSLVSDEILNLFQLQSYHMTESGSDVIIDWSGADKIVIENASLNDLDEDNFIFAFDPWGLY